MQCTCAARTTTLASRWCGLLHFKGLCWQLEAVNYLCCICRFQVAVNHCHRRCTSQDNTTGVEKSSRFLRGSGLLTSLTLPRYLVAIYFQPQSRRNVSHRYTAADSLRFPGRAPSPSSRVPTWGSDARHEHQPRTTPTDMSTKALCAPAVEHWPVSADALAACIR